MKKTIHALFAIALSLAATSAQIIKPGMPQDGSGLTEVGKTTFRHNIGAASIAELEQRERSGYLVSNGVTANRAAGIWQFGSDGAVAGQAITIPFEFVCSTTPPAQSWNIASFGPVHGDVAGVENSLYIRVNGPSSGNLTIGCTGATGSDIRNFAYAGFVAAYAGQYVRGVAVFEPGSTTPSVVVVNGKSIKDEMSLATSGTPATYLNSNLETTYYLTGWNAPVGMRIWPHAPILGAVTTDEAIEWTRGGDWPSWVYQAGAAENIVTNNDFSSFTGTADDATPDTFAGWSYGANQDVFAISGGVRITTKAGYQSNFNYNNNGLVYNYQSSWIANKPGRYLIRIVARWSGSARNVMVATHLMGGSTSFSAGTATLTNAFATYDLFATTNATNHSACRISIVPVGDGTGGDIEVQSIKVIPLGSLALPRVQPILALDDRLGRYGARVLGFTPVTFGDSRWRIVADTATAGNERILGGAVFADYESVVIDDVVMTCINNNTVTLGSSSGGAQYKTSGALVPGTNVISLVTRLPASDSFWVGSNSNYPIRTWITGHMAGMHVNIP